MQIVCNELSVARNYNVLHEQQMQPKWSVQGILMDVYKYNTYVCMCVVLLQ